MTWQGPIPVNLVYSKQITTTHVYTTHTHNHESCMYVVHLPSCHRHLIISLMFCDVCSPQNANSTTEVKQLLIYFRHFGSVYSRLANSRNEWRWFFVNKWLIGNWLNKCMHFTWAPTYVNIEQHWILVLITTCLKTAYDDLDLTIGDQYQPVTKWGIPSLIGSRAPMFMPVQLRQSQQTRVVLLTERNI